MTESKKKYALAHTEERKEANRKYWKTPKGKLMLTYNNMNRRVRGYVKPHLYEGKFLLDRDTFYKWSENDLNYLTLYKDWVDSDYNSKLSPSIDRIDSSKGYSLGNIQWITHSENSSKGTISRFNNRN